MDPKQLFDQAFEKHQAGALKEAARLYQEVIRLDPDHHDAWHLSGVIAMQSGDPQRAIEQINQALKLQPDYVAAHCNLAYAQTAAGQTDAAQESYQRALQLQPDHVDAGFNLANLLFQSGAVTEAIERYQALLRRAPEHSGVRFNLANAYLDCGQLEQAIAGYQQLLKLEPDHLQAAYNCAIACAAAGDHTAAIELYQRCLDIKPEMAEPYINLSNSLLEMDRVDEAEASLRNALARWPDFAEALGNLGNVLSRQARAEEACQAYARCLELAPNATTSRSDYLTTLHYLPDKDLGDILAASQEVARFYPSEADFQRYQPTAEADRRLRIGYLSSSFRNHPVGYFLGAVLPQHDRNRVEVFCYQNGGKEDSLTAHLKSAADQWRAIGKLDDRAAAQCISEDQIDILIDLEGHTSGHRLGVFALRAAPVQASWIGYFGTTGLPTMDHLICDRWTVPEAEAAYYLEKPARLPNGYLCFMPPLDSVAVGPLPARNNGHVTFGCFNNLLKVNEPVLDCWAQLLLQIPDSKLFLKYMQLDLASVQTRIRDALGQRGIAADRLIFEGSSSRREYLECYNRVDLAIDPFPFCGGTTTAESLWMGVPVITLSGERFAGRISESILRSAGLDECVANSRDEYQALAVDLASDLKRLETLRSSLRERIINSPLCDSQQFARDLEGLYRKLWREWCEKKNLQSYGINFDGKGELR